MALTSFSPVYASLLLLSLAGRACADVPPPIDPVSVFVETPLITVPAALLLSGTTWIGMVGFREPRRRRLGPMVIAMALLSFIGGIGLVLQSRIATAAAVVSLTLPYLLGLTGTWLWLYPEADERKRARAVFAAVVLVVAEVAIGLHINTLENDMLGLRRTRNFSRPPG